METILHSLSPGETQGYTGIHPRFTKDYLEVWLRTVFSYLGIKDIQFIFADGAAALRDGKADRSAFLAPHIEAIQALLTETVSS